MKYFSVIIGEGCNAKCPFCIAPDGMKNSGQLTSEGLLEANKVAKNLGLKTISISGGGEPLMLALKNPTVWNTLCSVVSQYEKRDLHSNYSFQTKNRLFPLYNHVTVSLWPNEKINKEYMGYSRFKKTLELIKKDSNSAQFRLSAILGTDWANNLKDLEDYFDMALRIGAKSVTLRTFQKADHEDLAWIEKRYTDGQELEKQLAQKYPLLNKSLRNLNVYDYRGLKVMFYRYASELETEDVDFLYYRPHTKTGEYGLYTDYSDDSKIFVPALENAEQILELCGHSL